MIEQVCTVIYDSECGLCTRFKKALEFIDTNKVVCFLSLHDPEVYSKYPQLTPEICSEEVHLITSKGVVHVGPGVLEYLIEVLPGVKKFAWLMDNDSAKKASKAFYGKLNQMRRTSVRGCSGCGKSTSRMK